MIFSVFSFGCLGRNTYFRGGFVTCCLFPYLQHMCSTLTQMACLITVCISRRLSKFGIQAINKENPCNSSSHTDFFVNTILLFWLLNHHILCSTFYKCIPIKRTEVVCVNELLSYWLALLVSASVMC